MNIPIYEWLTSFALVPVLLGVGLAEPGQAQEKWKDKTQATPRTEAGVPITLEDALAAARSESAQVAIAEAHAEAARQQQRMVAAPRWPSLSAQAGAMLTEDPVGVFGARLRQARFTQADFEPALLNDPEAFDDWNAGLMLAWTPLDFSRSAGIDAAQADAEAAELSADWAVCMAEFEAEIRYLEAVGAELLLGTAESAVEAARANLAVIARRHAEGLLTRADVLQAESASEAARVRQLAAEKEVADARGRLALAMGWTEEVPIPTGEDLDSARPGDCSSTPRADLSASEVVVRSARAKVDQAGRSRLPRVQGFARFDRHSAAVLTDGVTNWTVGFNVSLPLFTGFQLDARRRAASAAADAADLDHDYRLRQAGTRLAEARRAVGVSDRAARAAEAASEAASEAARLMRRRLEQGLSTTADLLGAEARAADLAAAAVHARLDNRRALAQAALLEDARLRSEPVGGFDR